MSDNKKEQILGELTTAYWMEMETVMNYVCNSVDLDVLQAEEVKKMRWPPTCKRNWDTPRRWHGASANSVARSQAAWHFRPRSKCSNRQQKRRMCSP